MWGVVRIAFRNTRRQARRSVLLGGAIAFGVMIITLVNAFTQGAVGNVEEQLFLRRRRPHFCYRH